QSDGVSGVGIRAVATASGGAGLVAQAPSGAGTGADIAGGKIGAVVTGNQANSPCMQLLPSGGAHPSPLTIAGKLNFFGELYVEQVNGNSNTLQLWWSPGDGGYRRVAGPDTAGALTVLPAS